MGSLAPAKFQRGRTMAVRGKWGNTKRTSRATFLWLWLGGRRPVVAAPWEQAARGGVVSWWWHAGEVERERPGLRASLG